jgi:hypothetical protein
MRPLLVANSMMFFVLAVLHLFWAMGGSWALDSVIPSNSNGRKIFKVKSIGTFMIAVVLLVFVMIDISYCGWIIEASSNKYIHLGILLIAILFLLRAIGDFRYIGFFKKYKNTPFAKKDLVLFSPICLFLSISHALAYWAKESSF